MGSIPTPGTTPDVPPGTFPCTSCGLCCRLVGLAEKAGIVEGLDRGDGTCKNLDDETNRCRIYETRPDICRVDFTYKPALGSRLEHYNRNIAACRDMQADVEMPERHMIQLIRPPKR